MIVVTGAAGFIGSCLISKLNQEFFNQIVAVDEFTREDKIKNLQGKKIHLYVDRNDFFPWLKEHQEDVEFVFHLGARTDTTLTDMAIFEKLNVSFSKDVWRNCVDYQIPLIYASSAATYGSGLNGFVDDEDQVSSLEPLNSYGVSKNNFDQWALLQHKKPFYWCGLKFFNVYGPNEYHKGRMASVVFQAFRQIQETGQMQLFKSHNPSFKDGEQLRDFIYVKDVVDVLYKLMHHRKDSGLYNLGTGKARSFLDLTKSIFLALGKEPEIKFVDTPLDIRDNYQYFTEANMEKMKRIGINIHYLELGMGIEDYVSNYLLPGKYL